MVLYKKCVKNLYEVHMRFCQIKYVKFLALLFLFFTPLSACEVDKHLNKLSLKEKKSLEHFFTMAIKDDHLGHVLFFPNKPACLVGRAISDKQDDVRFLEGWKVWKENEQLFPHPNFIIHHEMVELRNGNTVLHIYFINKKTWNNLISNGCNIDEMIGRLEERKLTLFDFDSYFKGLLLGFGKEASNEFKYYQKDKRINELQLILCAHEGKVKHAFKDEHPTFALTKKANVLPVTFLGNPDSKEVQLLQNLYADELEQIEAIFQKKDLLGRVLQALCEDS